MTKKTLVSGLTVLSVLVVATVLHGQKDSPDTTARAVDAFNQRIIGACARRDFDATAALWADDGVDLLPGLAPMVGKIKIKAWLDSLRPLMEGSKVRYCTIEWRDIQFHGDVVYEWGTNRQFIEFPPPKKSTPNEGKILYILKRQPDGQWKIALESWNSSPLSEQHP